MTSPTIPGFTQQDLEGRSVRDVVEYSPGEVNDAWCRKVLHKMLKSLELQYAMQMPHRAITPDTVVFHANGEPLLISDDIDAAPAPDAHLADDLTALARIIHYAITHELAPAGPLKGRVDGYSAAVVAAIDACMDPDPTQRPRSVDALRGLLGMTGPGPIAGAVTLPALLERAEPDLDATPVAASAPSLPPVAGIRAAAPPISIPAPAERSGADPAVDAHPAGMRRGARWAVAAGGGAIAIALALAFLPTLRDAGPNNHTVLTPPRAGANDVPGLPAPGGAASAGTEAMDARTDQATGGAAREPASAAATAMVPNQTGATATQVDGDRIVDPASNLAGSAGASSGGATQSGGGADQRNGTARAAAAAPVNDEATTNARAGSANASYQLQIKPWGVVYVDGVERGVSPPVKRLALTPGPHTIRITNPKYRDSILEFESAQTTSNGKIIVDFTDEAQ